MIALEARVIANSNIASTYSRLGRAAGGSVIAEAEDFHLVSGKLDHPLQNFALVQRVTPRQITELCETACRRRSLHVYHMDPAGDQEGLGLLLASGFQLAYRLNELVATDQAPLLTHEPDSVETLEDRRRVASFMTNHFFSARTQEFRDIAAGAIVAAESMELYSLSSSQKLSATAMLSVSPHALGLYNLCVAVERRGEGLGTRLVQWARQEAKGAGRALTLQCEPSLTPWYTARGFRIVGELFAYTVSAAAQFDTM